VIVRPGFVHTKMTDGLEPAPLATDPDSVADAIVAGLGRGSETIWAPAPLRFVMSALRHIPRPVFRRLPL
jgi:decaprenylphospho-beta-D-erythro-pentofuranosid-2-ulose 2-reductase